MLLWWQTVINWIKSFGFKKCKSHWCVKNYQEAHELSVSLPFLSHKTPFCLQLMRLFFSAHNKQHTNTYNGSFNHHLDMQNDFKKGNITWFDSWWQILPQNIRPLQIKAVWMRALIINQKEKLWEATCLALPCLGWLLREKKSLSLISWYGYNRKPRGMNMNLMSTRGKSLRELAGRLKSIKCEKGGKDWTGF